MVRDTHELLNDAHQMTNRRIRPTSCAHIRANPGSKHSSGWLPSTCGERWR